MSIYACILARVCVCDIKGCKDEQIQTPTWHAKIGFHCNNCRRCFPDRTSDNQTCLQLAINHRLPSVVESMCQKGADIDVTDDDGVSAIWQALASEQADIASILVIFQSLLLGVSYCIAICDEDGLCILTGRQVLYCMYCIVQSFFIYQL